MRFLAGSTARVITPGESYCPFSDRADRTVVAGQSFGGLSALMPDCTGLNALAVY